MNRHYFPRVHRDTPPRHADYGPGTVLISAAELSAAGEAAFDGHPGHLVELRRRVAPPNLNVMTRWISNGTITRRAAMELLPTLDQSDQAGKDGGRG